MSLSIQQMATHATSEHNDITLGRGKIQMHVLKHNRLFSF